jgi:hypothetical protein
MKRNGSLLVETGRSRGEREVSFQVCTGKLKRERSKSASEGESLGSGKSISNVLCWQP